MTRRMPRRRRWRRPLGLIVVVVALGALAACSGTSAPSTGGQRTNAATEGTAETSTSKASPGSGQTMPAPPSAVPSSIAPATSTIAPSVGRQRESTPFPSVIVAATAAASSPATAAVTLTPLGHNDFDGAGFTANVAVYGGFAYVGSWGEGAECPALGVRIMDLSDPAKPALVATTAQIPGTSQEDVKVRHIQTSAFNGDLLATGIQRCGRTGQAGVALYDVSNPRQPQQLGFFATGVARGVHELDLIQQGDRALALLAVPDSERDGGEGDFRIVDVSDPTKPVELAQWGVGAKLGVDLSGGIGCQHAIFDHSARASADGKRVYLSYWDAGVIVLDISDPTAPRLIGRIQYPADEEGETHSVAPTPDGHYLLVADESGIFGPPYGLHFRVDLPGGSRQIYGCEALYARSLATTGVLKSDVVAVGSGCPGSSLAQPPSGVAGKVALVDEGGCTPAEKASRLLSAGAIAMIVPQEGDPVSLSGGKEVALPIVSIRTGDAADLRRALAGKSAPITLPSEKHSGGLRIWDISDLSHPRQLAVYQTSDSTAFPPPSDGFYTVHNPEIVGTTAFVSWYSDGLRVIDFSDPAHPRELASYVPPAARNPFRAYFPDQTLDWGVAVSGDLVMLSDINSGLHVVRVETRP